MPHSDPRVVASLSQALRDITAEVLETMFYVFPEESPAEGAGEEAWVTAVFRFEGAPSGVVTVALTAGAARSAAANFLAIDEEETGDGQVGEVVCEMANMVGGCLLGCIENRTPLQPFPPELVNAEAFAGREAVASHVFYLENGEMRVSLYWE
ncbi:MAG: chemotaxis protein CheX [Bryobacterales bacterium]|nr:chemotaxis protein CheX [Bryobacterales bacterium]